MKNCEWGPLHMAAENGHTETVKNIISIIIKEFLEAGADVNATTKGGWETPLWLSRCEEYPGPKHYEVKELIIQNGGK